MVSMENLFQEQNVPIEEEVPSWAACPTCGKHYKVRCKCHRADSVCPDGHEWFKCTIHNKIIVGRRSDHSKTPEENCTCEADGLLDEEKEESSFSVDDLNDLTDLKEIDAYLNSAESMKRQFGMEFLGEALPFLLHKITVYIQTGLRYYRRSWMRYLIELKKTRDFVGQEKKMYAYLKDKKVTLYPPVDGTYPLPQVDKFSWITLNLMKRVAELVADTRTSGDTEMWLRDTHVAIQNLMDSYYNEIPYTKDELESALNGDVSLFWIDANKSWNPYPELQEKSFSEFFKTELEFKKFKKDVSGYYASMIIMVRDSEKIAELMMNVEKTIRNRPNAIALATENMAVVRRFFSVFMATVPALLVQKHPTFWNAYQIGKMYQVGLDNKEV